MTNGEVSCIFYEIVYLAGIFIHKLEATRAMVRTRKAARDKARMLTTTRMSWNV